MIGIKECKSRMKFYKEENLEGLKVLIMEYKNLILHRQEKIKAIRSQVEEMLKVEKRIQERYEQRLRIYQGKYKDLKRKRCGT